MYTYIFNSRLLEEINKNELADSGDADDTDTDDGDDMG